MRQVTVEEIDSLGAGTRDDRSGEWRELEKRRDLSERILERHISIFPELAADVSAQYSLTVFNYSYYSCTMLTNHK